MHSLNDIYEATEEVDEAVEENVNLVCFHMNVDPIAYADAAQDRKWKIAMDEEINAIEKNDTWSLTTLPEGRKAIGVKWVYKTKKNTNGEVQRYKARLYDWFANAYYHYDKLEYTKLVWLSGCEDRAAE
ncbi:hypothetical protein SASPL_111807 [Salvia splendens]|uniref:Reverse transcriptase Ty1/copia-type domain-containing protein n=1 Tax=Salvia splendens TaxID=180675 RepID=A0A8X8YD56_SALSN|nr:hypothetical protein SASPL_111807 [Salvia splendens]